MFARIDTDGVGRITCDQFLKGVQRIPFLRSVVSNYSPRHQTAFRVPADYDYATYTNANYGAPADAGFHGEFAEIRAGRDYGYHVNYARARQLWQDAAISMVVTRTHPQPLLAPGEAAWVGAGLKGAFKAPHSVRLMD